MKKELKLQINSGDIKELVQKNIDDWKKSLMELPNMILNLNSPIKLPQVKFQKIKNQKELEEFVNRLSENKVNNPKHYNTGEVECIDAIASALSLEELKGFVKGNIIKYIWRASYKEKEVEDLQKARWYLDYLIKKLE
jgi:hypothetical protein